MSFGMPEEFKPLTAEPKTTERVGDPINFKECIVAIPTNENGLFDPEQESYKRLIELLNNDFHIKSIAASDKALYLLLVQPKEEE